MRAMLSRQTGSPPPVETTAAVPALRAPPRGNAPPLRNGKHRPRKPPRAVRSARRCRRTPHPDGVRACVRGCSCRTPCNRSEKEVSSSEVKTDSAVRITHLPTGIVATSQDGRSQHDNRDKAMKALVARVYDYFQSQQTEAIDSERKSKVGTGDRAEKIRTYNYPQNRVTDHRIGLTIQQLDRIIEGKLDDIITALINEDQRLKLEGQK